MGESSSAPFSAADDVNSGTVTTDVVAYVEFVTHCPSSLTFKAGDLVRLERVKPDHPHHRFQADEFDFIHRVHGKVGSFAPYGCSVLCKLIDERHLELKEISLVEVTPMSHTDQLVSLTCWIHIEIRRESVELVSRILVGYTGCKVHLMIRPGGPIGVCNVFRQVFEKWKTSKQFVMESTKDAVGIELSPPADVIRLELYEHQKRGLRWMIDREECPELNVDNELPPFWEELNGVYRCELTSLITLKRPQNIRGGILADEPRMGKTLTLLSLIAQTKRSTIPLPSSTGMNATPSNMKKKRKFSRCLVNEEDVNFEWRPTLVVCPPSGLKQWQEQIQQCTWPGSLKICIYSGKSKMRDPNLIWRHDLVLTTYNILGREKEYDSGILNQIDWWRVVLDDAHVLNGYQSCFITPFINLKAGRRWAVTGKPVHKDCENYNIYPIFKFLQFEPFCNQAHWEIHLDYSASAISPSKQQSRSRLEVLMGIFSLRRTKPVRFIETYLVILSNDEQDLYNTMEAEAKKAIKLCPPISRAIVLHLWQSCNSLASYLLSCTEMVASANFQDISRKPELLNKWVAVLQDEEDYACPICLDKPDDIVITRCTHLFCLRCIMLMFEKNMDGKSFCPMCRGSLSKHNIFCIQRGLSVVEKIKSLRQIKSSPANMSSKVSSLLSLLLKSRKEDPHRKSVVISQFRKMLMLVKTVLSEAGFQVNCMGVIDDATRKAKTVQEFINAESPVVLLTTYKTLSKTPGLDLSAASTVYLMEPCLNAHTEHEALARTHRLGKNFDVNCIGYVRFVCKNTIEERVLEMRKQTKIAYGTSNSRKEVNLRGLDEIIKFLGF